MFSVLARGVGSWSAEVALQEDGAVSPSMRECRSAGGDPSTDSNGSPSSLNSRNGVHRHGITVSSHSLSTSTGATPSDHGELILPRTFTTRKGALMLFADDTQIDYSQCRHLLSSAKRTETRFFQEELEKLGSLTRLSSSVLTFGGDQDYDGETCSVSNPENKVFLKFLKSLGGLDVDLNVQPGGNTNDYLRNLQHRLIRAKMRSGEGRRRRSLLEDEEEVGQEQGRLVQSMSSIPQLKSLSSDHFVKDRGSQARVSDRVVSEFANKPNHSQKLAFGSEFSVAVQPSETVGRSSFYSAASRPGICGESLHTTAADALHDFFDKPEMQALNPISRVFLSNLSRNVSRPQSQTGLNLNPSAKQTTDEQQESRIQSSELTGDGDEDGDEENEVLNLAYGMIRDYDNQNYNEVNERGSPEVIGQDDDDGIDLVHPLMPAYDPTYDGLPSISKSFPMEISRLNPRPPPPPHHPHSALSVGAKPRSATSRASSGRSSSTAAVPAKNRRPATARTSRPTSTTITTTATREIKSAGHSVQRSPYGVINSRTRSKEIATNTDEVISPETTLEIKDEAAETKGAWIDEDKKLSKTLRITRMRTPSGREKKQKVPTFSKEPEEKVTHQIKTEAEDINTNRDKADSVEPVKVDVIETKVAPENMTSGEEVKAVAAAPPMSGRRKSRRTKGAKMFGEDNGLVKKPDVDKVALREVRRKEAELKKLLAEERSAEEKRLAEERKLVAAEEEKLAEQREREKEESAALAEEEAILHEKIADARRKAEEAREIEDAARNALATTWKLARERREEQRKANIERRKQELIERNRKEQECISNAKRKEQEMLERIGSSDELKRFRDAERMRKEETEHAQMLRLEDAEHSASVAYEKEEERYLEMEREAEDAAMAKLVQERLEADQRPEILKERQRRLRSEGSKKKSAFLAEEREREERLKTLQEEQERMEKEARQRMLEMEKLQEDAVEQAQHIRNARCSAVLQRRQLNVENRRHMESLRHDQTHATQPWTFSYYVHWPRETYAKLAGQDPRKKSGFRPPIKHSTRK